MTAQKGGAAAGGADKGKGGNQAGGAPEEHAAKAKPVLIPGLYAFEYAKNGTLASICAVTWFERVEDGRADSNGIVKCAHGSVGTPAEGLQGWPVASTQ